MSRLIASAPPTTLLATISTATPPTSPVATTMFPSTAIVGHIMAVVSAFKPAMPTASAPNPPTTLTAVAALVTTCFATGTLATTFVPILSSLPPSTHATPPPTTNTIITHP